eukprot:GFUD01037883.1.p1 GENE.GFUD01037883.1~~GFUD01037883.1.p1  ORF type:complete len:531 (+),score=144.30 GFUD01037883.1:113-1705(+)
MNNTIPGTVCCILCRGMVIYKDGDKSRFKNHMNNEHGAFFDIDYLLASCLLENDQKEAVAKTVKAVDYNLLRETNAAEAGVTLREESFDDREELGSVDQLVLKKERAEDLDVDLQCGSCGTQFGTPEGLLQHNRKGCKKEETKKKSIECDQCGKYYTSKQSMRAHKEKMHNAESNIKQERYDDPSMDPNQLYQRYPEESEMVTNNEEAVYARGDYEVNGMEAENVPTNEVLQSNIYPVEQELDQLLSEVRKRNSDVLQDVADESTNEDSVHAENSENPASERFSCEYEGCGKSYTQKSNRQIHMKKAHNIISKRAKSKKFKGSLDQSQDADNEGQEKENNLKWDELEKIRAQYYSNPAEGSPGPADSTFEENDQNKADEETSASFLTDTSIGFEENKAGDNPTNQAEHFPREKSGEQNESFLPSLDISQSKYFAKNPKVITSARGKSLSLFNEVPAGLPENWKMRTFEVTTKSGDKSMIKHYLTPELKVLKTGLAVVEYLRLKEEMGPEQVMEFSKNLNIPEKKLKSLYD